MFFARAAATTALSILSATASIAASDLRYACDGTAVTVLPVGEAMVMAAPDGMFALQAVPAASGAKYADPQNAGTFFWSRGAQAMISVEGVAHAPCNEIPPAGKWRVEDIDGQGILDNARAFVLFDIDGQVSGIAACNRFTGPWSVSEAGLSIGHVVTTRMGCAPEVMEQERAFVTALGRVAGFVRNDDGVLVLTDGEGAAIITARR
jgi:putative lipoprotein